jgi:hypothetical protein
MKKGTDISTSNAPMDTTIAERGPKRNRIEHDHQSAFFQWLRLNQNRYAELKRFFAIPNGGARSRATAIALYLEGVQPGVPDTHLPIARKGKRGLWLEFKSPTGTLSPQQRDWIAALESEGHLVYVVRDWVEAAHLTAEYLGLANITIPERNVAQLKRGKVIR